MAHDRRTFLAWLGALPALWPRGRAAPPVIAVQPSALYQQPDGRRNLVRVTVTGLDAPAARAAVIDRRGALVGSAGLLPTQAGVLHGEVWVPLSEPTTFRVDVEVARRRVARQSVRLVPPRRWTVYWLAFSHTDVGYTDLQERCLEVHRVNLDAALARLERLPDSRWTAECALQVTSYVENRGAAAADTIVAALRDGRAGWGALFAHLLTGLLDHETFARAAWPAGLLARERGLGYAAALLNDVPGQSLTFPMLLAASGVRYLATGVNPERALPLMSRDEAARQGLAGDWPVYPQLYWWEGPDGSRVLHWRARGYGEAVRLGLDAGPDALGRGLSDWLLTHPVFQSPDWPYDVALLYGADSRDNASVDERLPDHVEEFRRRFAFPRLIPARAEDALRDLERRYGARIPVRRGDTGLYREDGAASRAAALARFRRAQLAARAAELVALWDGALEPADAGAAERVRRRAAERRAMWRDLLLFGEHTWGAAESVTAPDSRQAVAQWAYKERFVDGAEAAARGQLDEGLRRLGRATEPGAGRVIFNASSWDRTDVVRVPGGRGEALSFGGQELPTVDLPEGDALALVRDVPALGYVACALGPRDPRPPVDEGPALDAAAGGFQVALDPVSGAVRSLVGPDGAERVRPERWSGLNQLVYVRGGANTALWTTRERDRLGAAPELVEAGATLVAARRERLPGLGVRLVADRSLSGLVALRSTVTLYDELPWVDVENRLDKEATLEKEALYVAFPFALTRPSVEIEVPLGRMTVERDQQPGSCRDWYCHAHWVWLHDAGAGMVWSGPDTPLVTLNDLFRGQWRRRIAPDGTLFAYAMHNYWHSNFAARQGGPHVLRFRLAPLAPGDPAEPVRWGWAACDPLYAGPRYENAGRGPLLTRDRALRVADPGVLVVGAKPADDGEGAVVKLLDVAGQPRGAGVWPSAWRWTEARRTNLVEMNEAPLPVAEDGGTVVPLAAWGVSAARLFTPREGTR